MKHRHGIMCALLLLAGAWPLAAQNSDSAQNIDTPAPHDLEQPKTAPGLKPGPLETLRNSEPSRDEEYRIGKGDEITINIAGRPDMQAKLIVGPNGRISEQVVGVDFRALMQSGNAMADLRLRRDHVAYVPSISERFISVLGEVQHPGAIPLAHDSTVASMLAQAGGLTDHAGNNAYIQIIDPANGGSRVLTLNQMLDPSKSLEVTLKPGDIIYVPESGFYRGTYVLERFSPLITVASLAVYVGVL